MYKSEYKIQKQQQNYEDDSESLHFDDQITLQEKNKDFDLIKKDKYSNDEEEKNLSQSMQISTNQVIPKINKRAINNQF